MLHPRQIRIVVADGSPLAVRTICSCLEDEPTVQIVGTASDGVEALAMAEKLRPDLVLLDLELPRMNGLEVASRLATAFPAILVVIVTSIDVFHWIAKLSELGVYGIVAKQGLREQLPQLLHRILHLPQA